MLTRVRTAQVVFALLCSAYTSSLALGIRTHALVNGEAAVGSARFDGHLRVALGFDEGVATRLRQGGIIRDIAQWLGEGGEREDDLPRFVFHFHDPLRLTDSAGLGLGPARFASSVIWMHDRAQLWSWASARARYYQALTEIDPVRREALWADLFRSLGQIMHLVVDASVPEHTRNDMHPLGAIKVENSYERWVGSQHAAGSQQETAFIAKYLATPVGVAEELLTAGATPGEPAGLLPVARLVDADRYDGTNPGVTVGADSRAPVAVGLAEIANANFFSEDTLRGQYPSPTDAGLIPVNLATPLGKVRRYFSRPAGQKLLPANPLMAECASDAILRGVPVGRAPYPCVDPLVWQQVAIHMLPRAVGYARGVLDYFFRGSMAVTEVTWDASGVRMDIWNTSAEEMEGVFEVWARHDPDSPGERRTKLATLGGGERIRLAPGDLYTFERIPIPPDARPAAKHVLVFKGRLGAEDDAVAAQVFTIPHVDVRQATYAATTEFACAAPASSSARTPYPDATFTLRNDSRNCGWRIVGHHATGTLATNMPIDQATQRPEPALAKIEARWTGYAESVPLVVDGRSVGRTWLRQGSEPDPTTFEIHDPTVRVATRPLSLVITYTNGGQAVFRMVRIISAGVTHEKMMLLDNRTPAGAVLVASRRSATALLSLDLATQFETVAHGGFTAPLRDVTHREFGSNGLDEGIVADRSTFLHMTIDEFQTFPAQAAAQTMYDAIELKSPHPDGPTYGWDADVRRIYQPMEVEFLRAFVTSAPVPFTVKLTGGALAGTQ